MGIFLLTGWSKDYEGEASKIENLSAMARARKEKGLPAPTLLVDGIALVHLLFEQAMPGWEWSLGGEYAAFDAALRAWVERLLQAGLKCVVTFDPAHGTEAEEGGGASERKSYELDERFRERCGMIGKVMQLLHEGEDVGEWDTKEVGIRFQLPQMSKWQAIETLQSLGVECITFDTEADQALAALMREREEAYAVVGSDSDFLIMRGVRYIPFSCLEPQGGDADVLARVYTPELVATALGLPVERLPDLAALCGNDITGEFLDKHNILSALGVPTITVKNKPKPRVTPTEAAKFLRALPPGSRLVEHEVIRGFVEMDGDLAKALRENEDFYTSAAPCAGGGEGGLEAELRQGLKACTMPVWVVAAALQRKMYLSVHVEPLTEEESTIETMLRPLRQFAYTLISGPSAGSGHSEMVEFLRKGMCRVSRTVPCIPPEELIALIGTADLLDLRSRDEYHKAESLFLMVHRNLNRARTIVPDPNDILIDFDPLCHLSDTIYMPSGESVQFKSVALLLRYMVLLNTAGEESGVGIVVGSWEFDCLVNTIFLLHAGADPSTLPMHAPIASALEVASLFVASATLLDGMALLLDLPSFLPPPALLFSGRLYAHLHSRTPQSYVLVQALSEELPSFEMGQLRECVLGLFVDGEAILPNLVPEMDFKDAADVGGVVAGDNWREALHDDPNQQVQYHTQEEHTQLVQQQQTEQQQHKQDPFAGPGGARDILPIEEHKDRIMDSIAGGSVTCIHGETGCGKSSMVPQFIVNDAVARGERVKIMVTQPRRIAAVTLARRVADQYGEQIGGSVGYRIGQGDHVDSPNSKITFVTVGYLLQYLSHNPTQIRKYTHLVLDEVHERSMDADMLNLLIKKLTETGAMNAKLVVMSATLQAGLFGEYFTPPGEVVKDPIFVGVRRFPVRSIHLEEVCNAIPAVRNSCGKQIQRSVQMFEKAGMMGGGGAPGDARSLLMRAEISPEIQRAIVECTLVLAEPDSCILIFLPGIGEISTIQDDLEAVATSVPLQVLVLHSLVPREEQDAAMHPAQRGCCKVILSTNIAESSITIPDVVYVIDSGLHRGIFYDDQRKMPSLLCTWVAQASAKQRAGRAGRVKPGTIIHMFTKSFHERCMAPFDEAEILRIPLEKTVLNVKLLLPRFGSITQLLNQSLSPSPPERVLTAMKTLYDAGGFTTDDEEAEVTELGRLAVHMPVDLPLVKLILLGRAFGCVNDTIVIAAALSLQDVFQMPSSIFIRDVRDFVRELFHNFDSRFTFDDGMYSEPLSFLRVYSAWLLSGKHHGWCKRKGLSMSRAKQLDMFVADLTSKVLPLFDATRQDAAVVEKLTRLHKCSRSNTNGLAQLEGLFTQDLDFLRFIIAGSFAPMFLQGAVEEKFAAQKDIEKLGLDPSCCVLLSKITPKECAQEGVLAAALNAVGVRARCVRKLGPDKVLVELARRDDEEQRAQRDAKARTRPLVKDMCHGAKFLFQLHNSSRKSINLPNPNARPGSGQATEISIGGILAGRSIKWRIGASAVSAMPNWRTTVSNMSEFKDSAHRFASCLSVLGTENENRVRAIGVTLLPDGLFGKVLQIIFTPPDAAVRLCVSADMQRISAATVGSSMVSFKPASLSPSDLASVNAVRKIVSDAISGERGWHGDAQMRPLVQRLMQVLTREVQGEEGGGGGGKMVWVPVRMVGADHAYLPEMRLEEVRGEEEGGGGGGGGAVQPQRKARTASADDGAVKISLLCSNEFNVAAQLPAGLWMTSREECASGTHSWYEICIKEIPQGGQRFVEAAKMLFKWFRGATTYDEHAILEFPPLLSAEQRKNMHTIGTQMGLAHNSYGPKSDRRLMICRNLQALKHIQKRGGVSAVASGGGPIAHKAPTHAPPAAAAGAGGGLLGEVKRNLYDVLLPYHPQGLLINSVASEYENAYHGPIPFLELGRGRKWRLADVLKAAGDVLVVTQDSRTGKERVAARVEGASQHAPFGGAQAGGAGAQAGGAQGGRAQGGGGGGQGGAGKPGLQHASSQSDLEELSNVLSELELAKHTQQTSGEAPPHPGVKKSLSMPSDMSVPSSPSTTHTASSSEPLGEMHVELIRGIVAQHGPKGVSAKKLMEALNAALKAQGHKKKATLGGGKKDFLTKNCGLIYKDMRYFLQGAYAPAQQPQPQPQQEQRKGDSPKNRLHRECVKLNIPLPKYAETQHHISGTWTCVATMVIGGVEHNYQGMGQKKVEASQNAADAALSALMGMIETGE